MKYIVLAIVAVSVLAACDKSAAKLTSENFNEELIGKWKLTEARSDPGDGSGQWRPVEPGVNVEIVFKEDGEFTSTDNGNPFNQYSVSGDSVLLFNRFNNNVSMQLAIQELNGINLSYYYGWPWCGGPTGSKYVRLP